MGTSLIILQVLVAVALVVTILIHGPKGEGLGGIGGQAKIFGSQKGLQKGLDRLTAVLAVAFVSLSLLIGILGV